MTLEEFRTHFAQTTRRGVFFDNASMGPVAPEVTAAMAQCMELRQAMPMKYYQYADQLFPACRGQLARLMGCRPEDIAFTENVAYGINCASNALPLERGDNVILCDREFASNVYPWLRLQKARGVEARIVPHHGGGLTVERLEQYADRHTRAVSVSSVEFSDGFATDLEAVGTWCRDHGAYLVVDCAQSLGILPMDVERFHIDFLAGLSSKWLLGPFSTGFLYVRKELAQTLTPPFAGADSIQGDVDSVQYQLHWKEGAQRFELGLPNAPGIAGLHASLSLMEQVGADCIRRQALEVSGYLARRLEELGADLAPCARSKKHRSSIVAFAPPNPEATYRRLRERDIACSLRCGYIRMGVHAYNTIQEADGAVGAVKEVLGL